MSIEHGQWTSMKAGTLQHEGTPEIEHLSLRIRKGDSTRNRNPLLLFHLFWQVSRREHRRFSETSIGVLHVHTSHGVPEWLRWLPYHEFPLRQISQSHSSIRLRGLPVGVPPPAE